MVRQPGFRTRTPKKQNQVVQELRSRILSGAWEAGDQLPIRTELETEFDVSSTTLQRALDQLYQEGFIFSRGSSGTFVSMTPPHTSHYGLILPLRHFSNTDQFWSTLGTVATEIEHSRPELKIPVFAEGINKATTPETARLLKTVEDGRLAALIFASPYQSYTHHPILMKSRAAKVCVSSAPQAIPAVYFDYHLWLVRAMDLLMAKGRKKIAVLAANTLANSPTFLRYWLDLLHERGATGDERWWVGLPPEQPLVIQCTTKLLMKGKREECPDGLIILNESLVSDTVAGLLECGITIPEDMDIVAHSNFPTLKHGGTTLHQLGFSIHGLLETCLHLVEEQLKGNPVPRMTLIEPVSAAEFYQGKSQREPLVRRLQ